MQIPILQYVGGEDYMRCIGHKPLHEGTKAEMLDMLSELAHELYLDLQYAYLGKGPKDRRIQRAYREYYKAVRYVWLHAQRKGYVA